MSDYREYKSRLFLEVYSKKARNVVDRLSRETIESPSLEIQNQIGQSSHQLVLIWKLGLTSIFLADTCSRFLLERGSNPGYCMNLWCCIKNRLLQDYTFLVFSLNPILVKEAFTYAFSKSRMTQQNLLKEKRKAFSLKNKYSLISLSLLRKIVF